MEGLKDKKFEAQNTLVPFLKRLFTMAFTKYPLLAFLLLIGVLITAIADAVIPKLWEILLNHLVLPQRAIYEQALKTGVAYSPSLHDFMPFIAMYVVWILTITFSVLLFVYAAQQIQERLMYELRAQMFEKLQYLSFQFYDKTSIGWLVSRITSDTNRVTEIISWGTVSVIWGVTMIVATFFVMLSIHVKLAFLVMLTLPVLIFVSIKIRMLILIYSRKARKQGSELTAYFIEHVNGIEVNKATGQENKASDNYNIKSEALRQYAYKSAYYTAMFIPLVIVIGSIATVLVIWYGGSMAVLEKYGFGISALSAFFIASRAVFDPIFDISRFYAMAQDSLAAGERIFSLIDEKVDVLDAHKIDFERIKGSIDFEAVDFHYTEEKPILRNFNLHINAGESIALVGPTGHGKTTVTALLNRFYDPIKGKIMIDHIDTKTRTLHSLRNQMGVILQSPHLFSGTIKDNVLFGLENIAHQKIIDTLILVGAESLIPKLNEEVGEEGSNLSNGERQLVSFARAILKNPAILILDEATSSIDTLTEAKIQKGIQQIIKGRTSIIIAHRLSTIKNCDRIVVIEHGKILEMGTHQELLANKGHYYELCSHM